jgi:hypothetical protein
MRPGKRLLSTRPTEKAGVRAVQALFEDAGYIFQPVELGNDIGKDACVDLAEAGQFTGAMVALQIKSGVSYRQGDNYKIPCNADDRAVWRGSSVPICGMVHDPDAGSVHWADLTTWARRQSEEESGSYCPVPRENLLSALTLSTWVSRVRTQLEAHVSPPVLDLMSGGGTRQVAAIYDCFALGRTDEGPSCSYARRCAGWSTWRPPGQQSRSFRLRLLTPMSCGRTRTGCPTK